MADLSIKEIAKMAERKVETVRRWVHALGLDVGRGAGNVSVYSPEQVKKIMALKDHSWKRGKRGM